MKLMQRSIWAVAGVLAVALASDARDQAAGKVEVVRNQAYVTGGDADGERHKVDLYLPTDKKDFPVLLFFHGGGYTKGDRKQVEAFGQALASRGVGVAAVGYRLAPATKHPGQAKDAARAVAWVKNHIAKHGGRADGLYVGGHSAGAHLAALIATDEQYLKEEGLSLKNLRGVVALSGPYEIPESRQELFGDAEARKKASPLHNVREGLPAFFLAYADKDSPNRDKDTKAFADALKEKRVAAEVYEGKDRDHGSLFTKIKDGDPAGAAVLAFVGRTERRAAETPNR